MEVLQSFIVYAYPERDTESVLHSRAMAEDTRERLTLAFNRGIDEGKPRLVPLYDYEDVAWDQPSETRRSVDFARVRDFGVSLNQNPNDETLWAVLAEVRLGWSRDALLPSSEKTAQNIRVGFTT